MSQAQVQWAFFQKGVLAALYESSGMIRRVLNEMGTRMPMLSGTAALTGQVNKQEYLRLFELHRSAWERQYPAYLLDAFAEVVGLDLVLHQEDIVSRFGSIETASDLSLPAKSELLHIHKNLESAVSPIIDSLDALMSAARGGSYSRRHRNPLRPENYLQAMQKMVFASLPGKEPMSIVVLKQFAALAAPYLVRTYSLVITALSEAGVVPVPKRSMSLARMTTGHMSLSYAEGKEQGECERYLARSELLEALGQHALRYIVAEQGGGGRGDAVTTKLAGAATVKAPESQASNAQPVRLAKSHLSDYQMLLLGIVKSVSHLQPIKAQLALLQPSLRKLIQTDPAFLRDANHPARVFLQHIQAAAQPIRSIQDPAFAALDESLRVAIAAGHLTKVDASHDFAVACQLVQRAAIARAIAPPRLPAETAKAIKPDADALLLEVVGVIQSHTLFAAAHDRVQRFTTGPWAKVIAKALLRHAKLAGATASADFSQLIAQDPQQYLAVASLLLASVQAQELRRDEALALRRIPQMYERIREGLVSVGLNEERVEAALAKLKELHRQAVQDASGGHAPPLAVRPLDPTSQVAAAAKGSAATAPQHKHKAPSSALAGTPRRLHVPRLTVLLEADDALDSPGQEAWQLLAELDSGIASDSQSPEMAVSVTTIDPSGAKLAKVLPYIELGQWVVLEDVQRAQLQHSQLSWVSPDQSVFMFTAGDGSQQTMTRRRLTAMYLQGSMHFVAPK